MTFFRHTAFLLPSAFLLGVLLFLLTHGRQDAGFGTYPFFEAWGAQTGTRSTPEFRFLEQSLLFFLPLYLVSLLFVLCIAAAETALYGPRRPVARSAFDRAFRKAFPALYMVSVAVVVLAGDRLARAYAPGALVTPVLVAFAPFLGAGLALLPAFLFAVPASAVARAEKS